MIKNLWQITEVVCGCHLPDQPVMTLKTGHRSMFYSCPKYYPENRISGESMCMNHVSSEDFEKILALISEEMEKQMIMGQSSFLKGRRFKLKEISIFVVEHTENKILLLVKNKKALS